MDNRMTALERAFELAKSGKVTGVTDIKATLKSEGYAINQVEGAALGRQLRALINERKERKADRD